MHRTVHYLNSSTGGRAILTCVWPGGPETPRQEQSPFAECSAENGCAGNSSLL